MIGINDLENIVNWERNRIILTFDDGYSNFYTNAYPLLKENKMPAVLFITTGFVQDQKAAWDDRLFYAIKNTQREEFVFALDSYDCKFSLLGEKQKLHVFKTLIRLFADELTGPKRDKGIDYVLNKLGISVEDNNMMDDEDYRPLSIEDIRRMAQEGIITFGSHTVNHYGLGNCDEDIIYSELFRSKETIEEWTGKPCLALSLPGGSWKQEVNEIAKDVGYKYIFNSVPGINNLSTGFYNIKRYCVREKAILAKHLFF